MTFNSKTVLVIDDNPLMRKALRALFEGAGYRCAEAESGPQGLELAEELRPDVIVLDFSMPVMNGLEAAPLFKRKFPQTPIIMFTLFATDGLAKVATSAGITAVVSKETAAIQLIPKIESILNPSTG